MLSTGRGSERQSILYLCRVSRVFEPITQVLFIRGLVGDSVRFFLTIEKKRLKL